jgi:hypothetical protein
VWRNVKHDKIARRGVTSKDDPKAKARHVDCRNCPNLVHGFFANRHPCYITA